MAKNYTGTEMILNINSILPSYALIDCGNGNKLERFGDKILIRPELSATGIQTLSLHEWEEMAHARFTETGNNQGKWEYFGDRFTEWETMLPIHEKKLAVRLQLSSFKHVGIFPEQAVNWEYLLSQKPGNNDENKLLNLFGYTGIASLFAAAGGFSVTHVDSLKQVVERGKEMMHRNNLDGIRWIVDDARDFVRREMKRGNLYRGVILDPPAAGKGSKGRFWKLEKDLAPLLADIKTLLLPDGFLIMSLYAGFAGIPYITALATSLFADAHIETCDEIIGQTAEGKSISHGVLLRLIVHG